MYPVHIASTSQYPSSHVAAWLKGEFALLQGPAQPLPCVKESKGIMRIIGNGRSLFSLFPNN